MMPRDSIAWSNRKLRVIDASTPISVPAHEAELRQSESAALYGASAPISVYGICALNVALAIVLPHAIAIRPPSIVIS
jgi:hypothetical protein